MRPRPTQAATTANDEVRQLDDDMCSGPHDCGHDHGGARSANTGPGRRQRERLRPPRRVAPGNGSRHCVYRDRACIAALNDFLDAAGRGPTRGGSTPSYSSTQTPHSFNWTARKRHRLDDRAAIGPFSRLKIILESCEVLIGEVPVRTGHDKEDKAFGRGAAYRHRVGSPIAVT